MKFSTPCHECKSVSVCKNLEEAQSILRFMLENDINIKLMQMVRQTTMQFRRECEDFVSDNTICALCFEMPAIKGGNLCEDCKKTNEEEK